MSVLCGPPKFQRAANGGSDPSWLILAFLGRPTFQSRGPQIPIFKRFWDLWTENRGAPKTPKSTTTDLTPHLRPSENCSQNVAQSLRKKQCNSSHKELVAGRFPFFSWFKAQLLCNSCAIALRAKGTLISEPRFSTPARCDFSHARKGNGRFQRKALDKGHFPFLAWEKSHLAGGRKSGLAN